MNPKTLDDIVAKFELQVNDLTELSTDEEYGLANDKYQDICNDRPWNFLKRSATGALTAPDATGMYSIPIPDDFNTFMENNAYTDNTLGILNNAVPRVVFIGALYDPYQVVNYSDRVQYRNTGKIVYLDPNAGVIYIPVAPSDTSFYQFDYISVPPDLKRGTDEPLMPVRFRKMISFAMAVDNDILQRMPQGNSMAPENQQKYEDVLEDMELWDADQVLNN